jgi:hypothetical protein
MDDEKLEKPQTPEATESAPAANGGALPTPAGTETAPAAGPGAIESVPAAKEEVPKPAAEPVPPAAASEVSKPADAAAPPPTAKEEAPKATAAAAPAAAAAAKPGAPKAGSAPAAAAKPGAPKAAAAPAAAAAKPAAPKAPRPAKPVRPRGPIDPTGRGGTASIFAGVAIIAPVLIRELTAGSDPFLLLPLTLILLAVALGGLRVAQAGKDEKLGRIGFLVASAGCLVLALMLLVIAYNDFVLNTRLQTGDFLLDLGFYLLVGGLILFGAASLQAGVLARGPMLLMVVSLPLGALMDLVGAFGGNRRFDWGSGLILGPGLHLGLKIMGLALIWMGYSILKTTKAPTGVKTG